MSLILAFWVIGAVAQNIFAFFDLSMEMWTDFVDLNSCGGVASIAMVVKLIGWMETGVVSLSLAFVGNRRCSSA